MQRGIYTLDSLEDVIVYGNTLLKQNKKQEANVLFDVCYRIDSNNLSVAFQKMNSLVSNFFYKNAYTIFESLCKENLLSNVDKTIFCHLFYYLEINKEQKESEFLNLEKERILIKNLKREDSIDNKIKICILNNDFSSAQTLIAYHKENKTIQDKFIENTVMKLHNMQKKKLLIIKQLIKDKKYTEAKTEIDADSKLILKDKIAFKKILDDKIVIESGRTINPTGKNANSFYQAIETKNYTLVSQFIKEDKRLSMYEELVNDILKGNEENKKIKFSDIIEVLMQNNMERSIFLLDKYLKQNKKEQYKDLVIDFIKASILEEDLAYTKPMIFLAQLNNNNSFFDLSNVLQGFYKSLSLNNKVLSKVYLDIIGDANKLGLSNMNIERLYVAVNNIKGLKNKEELMQKIACINELTNKNDKEKVLVKDNSMKALTPIFNEELASIYDLVIVDQKLTAKTLENLGMSKEKIENLVEEKVLKKVRRYEYTLTSTEQLNNYGKYLASNKEYDKAARCAIKCFEIEPEDERNIKQAFYSSLKQDNFIKAYEIFGKLKEKELIPKQTQNCYLYLFDLLLPLNDKDKNILTHLREEDFYFLDGKGENRNAAFENDIMGLILRGKNFPKAARLLKRDKSDFNHKIIEQLLHKIMVKNKNQLSFLEKLVDRKEYETIFTELSNKNIENSIFKKRILKIVGDILELKENKTVSNIRLESDNPIDSAIAQKKYSDALMCLSSNVTDSVKVQKRNGILKNLLTDMVCLMDEAKEKNDNEEDINKEENVFSIDTLVMLLNDRNISKALEEIENYLKISNKSEYYYLIQDLLKLDILNQDTTFERTTTELLKIKNADYVFDIETILPNFYDSLGSKKFVEARIYLDMIKNNEEYKDEKDFINQLTSIVDNAQNDSTSQVSYHIHNNFLELFEGLELSDQLVTNKEPMKLNDAKEKYDIVKNILLKESKKLEENDGVIVLSQKYTKYKGLFSKIASELDNIDIYAYGKDNEERILLKRGNTIDENKISHKELLSKANAAYKAGDYEKSLEINTFILKSSKEVKPFLLKNIGIVCLKLGKKEKAERLIKIADDMTYAQNLEYHYTDLLDTIVANAIKDGNETKARPKVDIVEFDSNEDNYGIKNIEEVSHLISQVGIPVLEACEKLGFDQEKTNIVTLLCARDCFIDQNDELGNKYLKMVEKTPNKTEKVKEVFQEITSNKKFYKNRSQEKQMILKSKIVGNVS